MKIKIPFYEKKPRNVRGFFVTEGETDRADWTGRNRCAGNRAAAGDRGCTTQSKHPRCCRPVCRSSANCRAFGGVEIEKRAVHVPQDDVDHGSSEKGSGRILSDPVFYISFNTDSANAAGSSSGSPATSFACASSSSAYSLSLSSSSVSSFA